MTYMVEMELCETECSEHSVLIDMELPVAPLMGQRIRVDLFGGRNNLVDGLYRIHQVTFAVSRDKHPKGEFGHRVGFWCKAVMVSQ